MNSTHMPLLSTIIPTHKRPHYLPRAIDSTLQSAPNGDVEVIVIPNGPDESWKVVAEQYRADQRIQWHPISTAHANSARNHGMDLATGRYLRFLDDDDYLLPGAVSQVKILEDTQHDLCTGPIEVRTGSGSLIGVRVPPCHIDNLTDLVISTGGISLPHSWLYRRAILAGLKWDESLDIAQDSAWLYALAIGEEHHYESCAQPVGVWVQHDNERISQKKRKSLQAKIWSEMLLSASDSLAHQHRLTEERRKFVARRLWMIICGAYYSDPKWWREMIDRAFSLSPETRPNLVLYKHLLTSCIPPPLILNITIPLLLVRRLWRRIIIKVGLRKTTLSE